MHHIRDVAACASCHAKIAPGGFTLEFNDPVGGQRTSYPVFTGNGRIAQRGNGKPIDGSGALASGETFQNESDLKPALLSRKDQFARNLVHKLLIHATGRTSTFRDHAEVDRIVKEVAAKGSGLRDLVLARTASKVFLQR